MRLLLSSLLVVLSLGACGDKPGAGAGGTGDGGGDDGGDDGDDGGDDDGGDDGDDGGEDPVDTDGDGVVDDEDCAPTDPAVYPGAEEICDGVDQDCNDLVDDEPVDGTTWYADADADGFGDPEAPVRACSQPEGVTEDNTDCDDSSDQALPGGVEICDGLDNDCNGDTDDADAGVDPSTFSDWYEDGDGDGYGVGEVTQACDGGTATATLDGDCDDTDAAVSPGETEICNDGIDDDCDELVDADDDSLDEASGYTYYPDLDEDGYGSDADVIRSCTELTDLLTVGGDCDDDDAEINPDAVDICDDGVDNDCNGRADPGCPRDAEDAEVSFRGHNANDYAGRSVSAGGDFDGDGVLDLLVGSQGNDVVANNAGVSYVVLGPVTAGDAELTDASLLMTGVSAGDESGATVSLAGDLDGDGYSELLIGAYAHSSNKGAVFGLSGPVTGTVSLDTATFSMTGAATDDRLSQYGLGPAGDLDGDGIGDVWVGSHANDDGVANGGAAYVFFGPLTGALDTTAAGAIFRGAAEADQAGIGFAPPGDIDGDGNDDLIVGAPGGDEVYVVFGPVSGESSPSDADVTLTGDADAYFGGLVSAGDYDGDGSRDLAIGARGDDSAALNAGAVFGFTGGLSGAIAVADASWTITGEDESHELGSNVASLSTGDVDADGMSDLLIGAPYAEPSSTRSGAAGMFYGPVSGTLALDAADQYLEGHNSRDELGAGGFLGDLDDDGLDDIILGAWGDDDGGSAAGAVFVFQASEL
jgi:hypothetical protein